MISRNLLILRVKTVHVTLTLARVGILNSALARRGLGGILLEEGFISGIVVIVVQSLTHVRLFATP